MFSFFSQTLEEKQTRQTNQNFILLAWLFFPQMVTHELAPDLWFTHKYTNEQVMNEGRWKWSLIQTEASVLFCICVWQPQPRCSQFPTGGSSVFPLPPSPSLSAFCCFVFFWWMVLHRQWCHSIFICFLLFGFHRKGRWAFMCLICHSSDSVPAFKALGAVWTKPSVWVGRFIKWQTGSLYLANVSRGRWR